MDSIEKRYKQQIANLKAELKDQFEQGTSIIHDQGAKNLLLKDEIAALTAERDGYLNGQLQVQSLCNGLQDSIAKYAEERKTLKAEVVKRDEIIANLKNVLRSDERQIKTLLKRHAEMTKRMVQASHRSETIQQIAALKAEVAALEKTATEQDNSIPGILLKVFTVSCIIFPCLFISFNFAFADEWFKSNHRSLVAVDSIFNDTGSRTGTCPISERMRIKKPLLFNKSNPKSGGSFIELRDFDGRKVIKMGFPNEFSGKKVSNGTGQNYTENNSTCNFSHILFGAFLGWIAVAFCIYIPFGLYLYFTQQRNR